MFYVKTSHDKEFSLSFFLHGEYMLENICPNPQQAYQELTNVSYGLWGTGRCHCRLISCNKCITSGGKACYWGRLCMCQGRRYMGNLCTFLSVCFFLWACLFFHIFIGVQLIYNVVLVSGEQQSESVIHMHISTLFQIIFPYRSLQRIAFPVPYSRFLLVIYFIYTSVYMSVPISQFIPSHLPLNFAVNLKLLPK